MSNSYTEYRIKQIATFEKSYSFSRAFEGKGNFKHIHYGDIHTKLPSIIHDSNILPSITAEGNFTTLNYGDILVADASEDYKDLGKAVCYLDDADANVISGLHTIRIKFEKEKVIPEYLINIFQTNRYRKFVWRMGTGISVLGLTKSNLANYSVFLPPLEKQKQIANYSMQINKKIQLQQEKIDLLKKQKKGYLQKIFNQELRFKDISGQNYPNWKSCKLSDFVSRVTKKNNDLTTNRPLTISAQYGLVDQIEFFNKNVASANLEGYYLLQKGEFAYNKSYSNGYPLGAIKRLDKYENGALSTLYICFKPKENVVSNFLVHYFDSTKWHKEVSLISVEGARNHGLLNVSITDFFETQHQLPSVEEQIRISNFLDTLNSNIQLNEKKLVQLQQQKNSFIQQMFI
ncbi:TPA: restriction endonuclease subunit S [Bacillus cereus]|uniref:restriction endonuclease subunit S n=1 Tax=unclassified Bacillus cereus group TaxID=2750818 RepID=UPI0022E8FF6E|nr:MULTISPECIES: restriction endonuclease subunit S [unclassified Bacillus cereus group]MDA1630419.1 restriction endonuclease subunit S [Bacillus cereus group sp. TH172LC]MDA1834733.1 restriction endonuclease subunit S [Bacillus cereus group sp. BY142LC]